MIMDPRKYAFLKAVLGDDGASALNKASARAPELEQALVPRAILAWLSMAGRSDFEGAVPGVDNTYLAFTKSEDRYSGSVAVDAEVYSFERASLYHLGACVAVALGADADRLSPSLRDLDIQRLGMNIDTLVKARVAVQELRRMAKAAMPGAEAPGPAHAATAPLGPIAATPPDPTQDAKGPPKKLKPQLPKAVISVPGAAKPPPLKVTKSQAETVCQYCDSPQFKGDKFRGCLCLRDLEKSVTVVVLDDGYQLTFKPDLDQDSILTLIESLGN